MNKLTFWWQTVSLDSSHQELAHTMSKNFLDQPDWHLSPKEALLWEQSLIRRNATGNLINVSCSRTLDCGNHTCNDKCHGGDCVSCPYLPKNIEYCPCKQTLITDLLSAGQERQSCLDPIPCCHSFCGKKLPCGSKGRTIFTFLNLWI